jgi:hypothetical protein
LNADTSDHVGPTVSCACEQPAQYAGPHRGTPGRSTHARGRTCGVSRTPHRSTCNVVMGFPVVLSEAEELDTAIMWPQSGGSIDPRLRRIRAAGRLGVTPGLRPFHRPRCAPDSTRNPPSATFTPSWTPGSGDPAEKGSRSPRWRQPPSKPGMSGRTRDKFAAPTRAAWGEPAARQESALKAPRNKHAALVNVILLLAWMPGQGGLAAWLVRCGSKAPGGQRKMALR